MLSQVDDRGVETGSFVDAIHAGDMAAARQRYGPARMPYERIEPVAESFGDLDAAIDAREGDVEDPPSGPDFTGWTRPCGWTAGWTA